jgi:hypothetical protein
MQLGRTPGRVNRKTSDLGSHTDEILADAEFSPCRIDERRKGSAI